MFPATGKKIWGNVKVLFRFMRFASCILRPFSKSQGLETFKRSNTIHVRAAKESNILRPPAVRTEIAKRSFYYYGCTLFNELS